MLLLKAGVPWSLFSWKPSRCSRRTLCKRCHLPHIARLSKIVYASLAFAAGLCAGSMMRCFWPIFKM